VIERSPLLTSNPKSRNFRYEYVDYYDDHEWLQLVVGKFKMRGYGKKWILGTFLTTDELHRKGEH